MKNKPLYRAIILFFVLGVGLLPTVIVSSFAQVEPPRSSGEITFVKTVGLRPNHCSTTHEIAVPVGTKVFYCFQINTGDHGITYYTLADDKLGILHDGYEYQQPHITIEGYVPVTIFTDTVNTAIITATNSIHPSSNPFIATDVATVTTWIPVATLFLPTILR